MFVLLLSTVACLGGASDDPSGIWMLTFPGADTSTTSCTDTLTENFVDAEPQSEDGDTSSDWTYTTESSSSGGIVFVEVATTDDGGAVLLLADAAFPGVETESGWSFEWEDVVETVEGTSHSSGYTYSETTISTDRTTVTLTATEDAMTGTLTASAVSSLAYRESDTFSAEVVDEIGTYGDIPALVYLEVPRDNGAPLPAYNDATRTDCSGTCEIVLTTSCEGASEFSAVRTSLQAASTYVELASAGQ